MNDAPQRKGKKSEEKVHPKLKHPGKDHERDIYY
jgi:hypothetical protein